MQLFVTNLVKFQLDNIYTLKEPKNRLAHAIFSKEGPNLINPEVTIKPKVIPKRYKLNNNVIKKKPILKIETPNNGMASNTAGTVPIRVLTIAVKVNAVIISLIFIGDMNRLVKCLLQISYKNIIL